MHLKDESLQDMMDAVESAIKNIDNAMAAMVEIPDTNLESAVLQDVRGELRARAEDIEESLLEEGHAEQRAARSA